MDYKSTIRLDVACEAPCVIVKAKQLDNKSRIITAEFFDSKNNNTRFDIPDTATAEFRVRRCDGVMISAKASKGKYTVSVKLSAEMLAVPGVALADIRLTDNGSVLSAGAFFIDIKPTATGRQSGGLAPAALNIRKLTAEDFATLDPKSDNTVYYVVGDDGTITQYIGDVMLSSGKSSEPSASALSAEALTATVGVSTKIDDTDYVTEG